ncbi:hypothetical protein Ae201684P_022262 [Aphanomyces euteiches]|uniref:Uncharacterized protein n=1 Tax=Aphanomyces euteiches TaxID=100861 RepID=A0A6G0X6K4_9STRA|nr:hypothetical protein Ae201684_008069 [Aphanomyces euteiches]KAH9074455.1 hypothetical protein Ae201684P_022262 [Aphanomyces euteiches]
MASPHFFRVNCVHDQVFSENYIRCYQNHGLKVIRCFPHCCPHMEYRGCGSSLSLRIDSAGLQQLDTLHAFGRFEIAAEPAFADGESIEWSTFSSDLCSKDNVYGMWLSGLRQIDENRSVLFHFNKNKTDASRNASLPRCFASSSTGIELIASAYSTPFTISSYRRTVGDKVRQKSSPEEKNAAQPPTPRRRLTVQDNAEKIIRVFQFCTAISIDDVPPEQWSALEAQLLVRCGEWSELGAPPTAMPIIPDEFRRFSQQPWTVVNETALKFLWLWFDKPMFEFLEQFFHSHRTTDNFRAVFEAAVKAFHETFVTDEVENCMAALEDVLPRIQEARTNAYNVGYNAFVCAFRESTMGLSSIKPQSSLLGCNGFWRLHSVTTRRLDVHPTIFTFFRLFTMVFALDLRMRGDLLFVQSKLLMFPAPWTMFHLDSQADTFHTLPNGEACGLDQTAVVGDYRAWIEFDTIQLWIYRWPQAGHHHCYLLRVWIAPCAFDPCLLRISWSLEEAVATDMDAKSLQLEERMAAWDDLEHNFVLQVDTTYTKVANSA